MIGQNHKGLILHSFRKSLHYQNLEYHIYLYQKN